MPIVDECKIKIKTEPDEQPQGMTRITATVKHPKHGDVASISAVKIVRGYMEDQVHYILDVEAGEDELARFATTIFNRFGNVRPWLISPGYRSGTGVWGDELDGGAILYIVFVHVEKKGIGSWALKKLLSSQYLRQDDFAVVLPTFTREVPDGESPHATYARQAWFFQKHGFRRIGREDFLAYSPSEQHPSRFIPPERDAPPCIFSAGIQETPTPGPPSSANSDARVYPLHYLLRRSTNHVTDKQIFDAILAASKKDPSSLSAPDWTGRRPLHAAARVGSVVGVHTLLQLGVAANGDLEHHDNCHHLTPLELCEYIMIRAREVGYVHPAGRQFPRDSSDEWAGNPDAYLMVAKILRHASGEIGLGTDEDWIRKNKWGCTCGQCTSGWMSVRMRYWLFDSVVQKPDMMGELFELFGQAGTNLPHEAIRELDELGYLPFTTQDVAVIKGYMAMFKLLAAVLDHPLANPRYYQERRGVDLDDPRGSLEHLVAFRGVGELQLHEQRELQAYISACGSAESAMMYALDCALDSTRQSDPPYVVYGTADMAAEWDRLPRCANDEDFTFVRHQLGLAAACAWGPYTPERNARPHQPPPPPSNFFEALAVEHKPGEAINIRPDDVDVSRVPIPVHGRPDGCVVC